MGGKALSFETKRLDADAYHALTNRLSSQIRECLTSEARIVLSYYSKSSFGDADYVLPDNLDRTDVEEFIIGVLGATEIVKNGTCWSFDYHGFQIDFVFSKTVEYTSDWMAWNDLSNLQGRIFKKLGLKFGHDGLWLPLRDGDQKFNEILLTTSYIDALEFIGYDSGRWISGFTTLEEIFEYVSDNQYFNPDIFLLDNRNAKARMRDSKRPTYTAFLKWCEDNKDRFQDPYPFDDDDSVYLDMILNYFGVGSEYCKAIEKHEEQKFVASKFNGNLVMQHVKIEGKELGQFMMYCKKFMTHDFILNAPEAVIISIIQTVYDQKLYQK